MKEISAKKNIYVIILLMAVITLVFSNVLTEHALTFLQDISKIGLANLVAIGGLKGVLAIVSSINISIGLEMNIGAILTGLTDVVDKAFNFFLISNGLIILQIFLLKISKFLLVKILIVILSLCVFIKKSRKITVPFLMVLLLINPGFSLYVSATKVVYNYTIPDTGNMIKQRFDDIKDDFQQILEVEGVLNRIKNTPKIMYGIVAKSLTSLIDVILVYFVSSLVLFLVFPGVFFYAMYLLIKKLVLSFTT